MSQETAALSVIIPVYKAGPDFVSLLTELAGQKTDFGYEVLIADDASPDGTAGRIERHLKSLSNPCFKLLRLSKNSGPAGARNFAVSQARGKLFLLIDADCRVVSNDYLARVFEAHLRHPDAVIGGGVEGRGLGWGGFRGPILPLEHQYSRQSPGAHPARAPGHGQHGGPAESL